MCKVILLGIHCAVKLRGPSIYELYILLINDFYSGQADRLMKYKEFLFSFTTLYINST